MSYKFFKSSISAILRPILICIVLLGLYQLLVWGRALPPSEGINQWQSNVIKAQRYVYDNNQDLKLILVGSSLTDNIKAEYIDSNVTNLAMAGGASQTGLEMVERKKIKPLTLLVEINDTIDRKIDSELIESLFNPISYFSRLYLPMFKDEYRPISVLVHSLKSRSKQSDKEKDDKQDKQQVGNSELTQKAIERLLQEGKEPLSEKREKTIRAEAEYIKTQIAKLKQKGWRVILFTVPGEERVENTTMHRQVRQLVQELFPKERFEWLSEPPSRDWVTSDGVHLVRSDAKDYAVFLKDKLLSKVARK